MRAFVRALGTLASGALLSFVRLAALLLTPFRLGRLLRTVSLPRFMEHRLRTTLSVLGISLGVAVLVAVVVVNRSILSSMTATVDDIAGKADLQVSGGGNGSGFAEALFDLVHASPGVFKATPILQQTAMLRDPRAPGERMLVLGVDMLGEDDDYFRSYASDELAAIKNDPLPFLNSPNALIISRGLADRLGIKLHDNLQLATAQGVKAFDVWGFIENQGVGRAFGGSVAVMYYQAMQVAFDRGVNIDRIDVGVAPGSEISEVAASLQEQLGTAFHVERPERKNNRILKMLSGMRSGLTMGSLIALLVGMFLIYNTMSISVVQRKREIGIMRALGITRGEVTRLLTLEGFLLGNVGSLLGIGIGLGLAKLMLAGVSRSVNELYSQVSVSQLSIDGPLLLGGFLGGIAAATLASAYPARLAARPSPVETLRTSGIVSLAPAIPWALSRKDVLALFLLITGALLLRLPAHGDLALGAMASTTAVMCAGALLMPRVVQLLHRTLRPIARRCFGLEAELANDSLPRDLGRSSATAGALMVGVAMAASFAVFIGSLTSSMLDWIDKSIPADLFITAAARFSGVKNVPMSASLRDDLASLSGVRFVDRLRNVEIDYREVPVRLISSDFDAYQQLAELTFLEGDKESALRAVATGGVMVSENFAHRFGVHLGDPIQLPVGEGTRTFPIAGVHVDYTSDQGTILMERSVYVREWGDDLVDTYKLFMEPRADLELARRTINQRYGEKYDLFVLTNREFKAEVTSMLDQVFAVLRVLELVALVIAVLGVVNSLLANVLDRVREIGVLRAVGMLRSQARNMIVIEGALIALCGVIGGLLVGAVTGWVLLRHINLVQTGWFFPYRPAWFSVAEMGVLAVFVSAVAALYPAQQAAGLTVAEALEYE